MDKSKTMRREKNVWMYKSSTAFSQSKNVYKKISNLKPHSSGINVINYRIWSNMGRHRGQV